MFLGNGKTAQQDDREDYMTSFYHYRPHIPEPSTEFALEMQDDIHYCDFPLSHAQSNRADLTVNMMLYPMS